MFDKIKKDIETRPMTFLPALFLVIVERCVREHVFKLGADYYLEKPIDPQKIKEMLQGLEILPLPPP